MDDLISRQTVYQELDVLAELILKAVLGFCAGQIIAVVIGAVIYGIGCLWWWWRNR